MNKQTNKLLLIIATIIVIVGAIFYLTKKFNMEENYLAREQIILSNNTGLDDAKIEEIAKSELNKKVTVNKVDRFGTTVQILADAITDEQKEKIVNKVNEDLALSISNDDVKITKISNTRIKDIIKPYIIPVIATSLAVLLYFAIIYNKLGIKKVLIKAICMPIATVAVYFSIIAITRIPFGRITLSFAIGIYAICITFVAICFKRQKDKILAKKEND